MVREACTPPPPSGWWEQRRKHESVSTVKEDGNKDTSLGGRTAVAQVPFIIGVRYHRGLMQPAKADPLQIKSCHGDIYLTVIAHSQCQYYVSCIIDGYQYQLNEVRGAGAMTNVKPSCVHARMLGKIRRVNYRNSFA